MRRTYYYTIYDLRVSLYSFKKDGDELEYDFKWFKQKVYELSSIDLNKYKEQQMERRITTLVYRRMKLDYKEFYELISKDTYELNNFIEYLTINVSEFFRNPEQWVLLKEQIIPRVREGKGKIKVWSSACSTGEEPYSLAMILDELLPPNSYEIIASDLDKAVLKKAEQGIYRLQNFDVIPNNYKKWFTYLGDERYAISDTIKSRVTFKQLDLLKDAYPRDVDLILCRNVLIYLIEEAKDEIYVKFSRSLVKKGILFVGSSEQIVNCKQFGLEAIKTYFYEKMC